jgi:hypothetical protein
VEGGGFLFGGGGVGCDARLDVVVVGDGLIC